MTRAVIPPSDTGAEELTPEAVSFRSLTRADLDLMHRWLAQPHVQEWYAGTITAAEIDAKYGRRIDGDDPTRPYLILCHGIPVGYIQTYRIRDYPDYALCLELDEEAAGVDLFVGEAEWLHRGLGTAVLSRFLTEVVFADAEVKSCVLGPNPENRAAIRCYEKVGFRFLKSVRVPDQPAPEYLMRFGRP